MPTLRLFAQAREAAGTGSAEVPAGTVADVLDVVRERYGPELSGLLPSCKVWVNGQPVGEDHLLDGTDEIALLPPVSGG